VSPSEGDSGCVADMAMDIENIVANTVLVKARHLGDRGRSKKWKEMLRLPPVAQCLWLRDELDHTYEFLVEQQPIGQELFHQFCAREHLLNQCTKFLEEVAGLKLLVDEKFAAAARSVFATYLAEGVSQCVDSVTTVCVCSSYLLGRFGWKWLGRS
jgi:hypothetical protein